jgi:hypothetical protein
MKRKLDWQQEEYDEEEENSEGSYDEEESEEPIIQSVFDNLSDAVSHSDAKDLLHSMAASKNILFWTPEGDILRKQQRIPVTNITDLLEYVLLTSNPDLLKPRALNSFLKGLAELGINKRWIRNKKALSDLMEKEDEYQNDKGQSGDASEDSSDDEETDHEDQDPDDNINTEQKNQHESEEKEVEAPCFRCGNSDVKVHRIVECPKCLWHDRLIDFPIVGHSTTCSICQNPFQISRKSLKSVMTRCHLCHKVYYRIPKRNKEQSYDLTSDEEL